MLGEQGSSKVIRKPCVRQWRTVSIFTTGFLLLPAMATVSEARADSSALRRELLWSSFDCAIDAAVLSFGPIDLLMRGVENEGEPFLHASSDTAALRIVAKDETEGALERINNTLSSLSRAFELFVRGGEQANASATTTTKTTTVVKNDGFEALCDEPSVKETTSKYSFSLFQQGDGSETDPDGIPTRYLKMQGHQRDLAAKALEATLQWRKDYDVDNLLSKPHKKFDLCKSVFPHYFVGRDKENHILFVQRPALLDLDKAQASGLTADDLLLHYVFVNEYLWQILEAEDPLGQMTSVLDMTGIKLGFLRRKDLVSFVKRLVSTMDSHYPQRAHKTLILNAPAWFNTLYKLISPLLRESTKKKIEIHSRGRKQDAALKAYLGEKATDVLPSDIWSVEADDSSSSSSEDDGNETATNAYVSTSVLEQELRLFVSVLCPVVSAYDIIIARQPNLTFCSPLFVLVNVDSGATTRSRRNHDFPRLMGFLPVLPWLCVLYPETESVHNLYMCFVHVRFSQSCVRLCL